MQRRHQGTDGTSLHFYLRSTTDNARWVDRHIVGVCIRTQVEGALLTWTYHDDTC